MRIQTIKPKKIIEFFLPNQCILCDAYTPKNLCETCLNQLKISPQTKPSTPNITQIITLMPYTSQMQKLLAEIKFHAWARLATQLSDHISQEFKDIPWKADHWLTVPIHWTRELKRGANHVDLLFKSYLKNQKINREKIIKRVKSTPPLFNLDKHSREKILKNAFEPNPNAQISGKTIVILDDILTTSATITELARTLKQHGAKKVYALCLCDADQNE